MSNLFSQDERTERLNGWLSFLFLMITQIILGVALVYQRYILGMPSEYTRDISIALLVSAYGYWLVRLYVNAVHPVFTWKELLIAYAAFVAMIAIPTYFLVGSPQLSLWLTEAWPILIGPAVILGAMWLAGYLGEKRMQKVLAYYEGDLNEGKGPFAGVYQLSKKQRRRLIVIAAAVGGATGGGIGGALAKPLIAAAVSVLVTILVYLLVLRIMLARNTNQDE